MIRITLAGAQGTGKSTVSSALANRLRAMQVGPVDLHSGLGQQVAALGQPIGQRASAESIRTFARLHLRREAECRAAAFQIFDRSLLDTLAYARVLGCLPPDEFKALCQAARLSSARSTAVLWLRVTASYPVLTPEDEPLAFRMEIDRAICELGQQLGVELREHAVLPETVSSVVSSICERLLAGG